MINNKKELKEYIKQDCIANGWNTGFKDVRYAYMKCLRNYEYYLNTNANPFIKKLFKYKLYKLSIKTGYTIAPNTFGKGLFIPHRGTIIINSSARLGENCVIQCGVNISENVIGGNHIYFGAGSKILSDVKLANDIVVGANAVVNKDFLEENIVVAGVPAKKISNNGFKDRIKI